ncbi:MAG TPA: AAA family ATPase, partial [Thermoplasmata archaeon]
MEAGSPFPSAAARAVASLPNGSGRTLVIAGPPTSGKSALLAQVRGLLKGSGVEVVELRGAHRDREAAFALVAPLDADSLAAPMAEPDDEASADAPPVPMAALGSFGEESGRSRRARGERQRATIMGHSYAVRTRGVREMDAADYWRRFCEESRRPGAPGRAILIDDGGFADAESRDYLLYLIERARYRPLLLVLVLDSSDPSYGAWEEKLIARGDVDWIRFSEPLEDPREASRFRKGWEQLPDPTRRILGFLALLQGTATEVTLSRVSRMPFGPLADALVPAIENNLVRVDEGKVTLRHAGWARTIPELLRPRDVREFHREIADALEAMHREPTPERRRELAEHYFHWEAGPTALRYL